MKEVNFNQYLATPVRVVDGDTVKFDIDLGFHIHQKHHIRIANINAPETYRRSKDSDEYAAGLKAKNFLIAILTGDPASPHRGCVIDTYLAGKYGRYIADIYVPIEDLGLKPNESVRGILFGGCVYECVGSHMLRNNLVMPYGMKFENWTGDNGYTETE